MNAFVTTFTIMIIFVAIFGVIALILAAPGPKKTKRH